MNRISKITKRDILDLFRNGIEIDDFWATEKITYYYFGRLEEIEFLKRLYALDKMPSNDLRYSNAEKDIFQHTINNDDYEYCWVFEDERFQLLNGSDEVYLKFICQIFHPAVRNEKEHWKEFFKEINKLLKNDGYELYPAKEISNRDVFDWRLYNQSDDTLFIPYSQRNKSQIKDKRINLSISRNARNQIYELLIRYDYEYQDTNANGYIYSMSVTDKVFNDIRQFYTPKCFNDQKQYVETKALKEFIFLPHLFVSWML